MSTKPPIIITSTSKMFWEGVSRQELLLQYDPLHDRYQFYPRPISLYSTTPLQWRAAAGTGVLVAITRTHFAAPGFREALPYLEGLIALDEGPRIFAPVSGDDLESLPPGRRMRIAWPRSPAPGGDSTGQDGLGPDRIEHPFHFQPISNSI